MVLIRPSTKTLTIQMRQVIDIAEYIFRYVRELFKAQFKYPEGNVLVFGAVVLHEGRGYEDVVARSRRE